jgi:predicted RNase H-like HicB family nuclease
MLKVTSYPAILEPTEDGYSAFFPDLPGAVSAGESYEAAVENAKGCLSLHIYGMQRDGDPIPNPSKVAEIMKLAEPGDYVALIEPDIFSVKAHQEDKSVRINIAFPKSLLEAVDQRAKQLGIDRSKLLQRAAREVL